MDNPVALASSVSVAYLQGLLDYLERHGVASAALLERAQLSPQPGSLPRVLRRGLIGAMLMYTLPLAPASWALRLTLAAGALITPIPCSR